MIRRFLAKLRRMTKPSDRTNAESPRDVSRPVAGHAPHPAKPHPSPAAPPRGHVPSAADAAAEPAAGDTAEPAARSGRRRRGRRGGRKTGERATSIGPSRPPEPAASAPAAPDTWDPSSFQVPEAPGKSRFQDLDLPAPLLHAIADLGFQYCTPIQAETLPPALRGEDVAGRAQTGTGKTAAFLLTIFSRLLREPPARPATPGTPRSLIIAPTRELVLQIVRDAEALGRYTGLRTVALYGGAEYREQRNVLAREIVHVVAATPGRLLDFHSRHEVRLQQVEILVIDEADRMLDMGFIPDVRRIVYATPPKHRRQTLLFSATLTPDVMRLASSWMREVRRVDIEPEQVAVDTVDQIFYIVTAREKFPVLFNFLREQKWERVLLFVNRRITAERLTRELRRHHLPAELISGALSQEKRTRTLEAFREGRLRILVATDVAGRGLHIEGVSHVVNYNVPMDPEDYVHRIGRTGRAGARGTSITFACEEESFYIPPIEEYIGRSISCIHPDEAWLRVPPDVEPLPDEGPAERPPRSGGDRGRRRPDHGRSGGSRRRG